MSTEIELAKARWAVRRAVMDVVAFDQHDWGGASDSAHADYLDDRLDEALKEYAEAYLQEQNRKELETLRARLEEEMKKPQSIQIYDPKNYYISEPMSSYEDFNVRSAIQDHINRRAD